MRYPLSIFVLIIFSTCSFNKREWHEELKDSIKSNIPTKNIAIEKSKDTTIAIGDYRFVLYDFSKSYGSIDGKPFMESLFTTTTSILKNDKRIYHDSTAYNFYLKPNYWPRVIHYPRNKVLVLLEQWNYEPNGSQVVGLVFQNDILQKRFETFISQSDIYYQDSVLFKYFKDDIEYVKDHN